MRKLLVIVVTTLLVLFVISNFIFPDWKNDLAGVGTWIKELFHSKNSGSSSGNSNCHYDKEALALQQEHIVQPGETWTTEVIDYRGKFRSESGAPYMIKYTGMKDFILQTYDNGAPPEAEAGPVQIKLPEGATAPVKMELYKKGACV